MKRRIAVILSVVFLFGTAACSSEPSETGAKIDQPVSTGPANAEKTTNTDDEASSAEDTKASEDAKDNEPETTDATIEEQVLVDEKDIVITATGLDLDGWLGPELKLKIENNSDTDVTIQTRAASINGYMVESMMSPDVAAGKKANDSVSFSNTDLEPAGITNIADIEFFFHIFTTEGWEEFLDTDLVEVKTSLADNFEYTYDDSGQELYNEKDIRIVAKGISDDDSWFGPGLILFIENSRDKAFTVQARDVSVNGYMIDASLSEDVYPGKKSITALTFFSTDLEKNDIESFEEVELSFHVFDTDEWETIVDTEKYTLTFD